MREPTATRSGAELTASDSGGRASVRRVAADGTPVTSPPAQESVPVPTRAEPPEAETSGRVDLGRALPRPPRTRMRRRPLFWILGLLVVGTVVTGRYILQPTIFDLLEKQGVLGSGRAFRIYLRIRSLGTVVPGEYLFVENQDFGGVLETLRAGPIVSTETVTFPEGYSIVRMAEAASEVFPGVDPADYVALATDGSIRSPWQPAGTASLEGLLFPDTYTLDDEVDSQALIERQLERFDEVAGEIGLSEATVVSPYEVVIVASIIEREVKRPEDRPKVARAIYNRLAKGMKLQIDATVFYGQDPSLTFEQAVENVTPYNTYRVAGLPPTPIANPGRDSLNAALNPAEGNWIYWVTVDKETGETVFNESYEAHKQAIADAKAAGTY
ncbi:MAG: endolytic transglycosylase MltG [Actinobacteria bacterium ATB1]|nr:endolytic transglycosylase MltG [Actinobacteria bacterium ATB1]